MDFFSPPCVAKKQHYMIRNMIYKKQSILKRGTQKLKNSLLTCIFLSATSAFGSSEQPIFWPFSLCHYNQAHTAIHPEIHLKHHESLEGLISDWNDDLNKKNSSMRGTIKEEIEILVQYILTDYRNFNDYTKNRISWQKNTFDLCFYNEKTKQSNLRKPFPILKDFKSIQKLKKTIKTYIPCSNYGATASLRNAASIEVNTIEALIPLISELVITACKNPQVDVLQKEMMINVLCNSKEYSKIFVIQAIEALLESSQLDQEAMNYWKNRAQGLSRKK